MIRFLVTMLLFVAGAAAAAAIQPLPTIETAVRDYVATEVRGDADTEITIGRYRSKSSPSAARLPDCAASTRSPVAADCSSLDARAMILFLSRYPRSSQWATGA